MNKRFSPTAFFCLFFIAFTAMGMLQTPDKTPQKVYVENADTTAYKEAFNPDVYVLRGNVVFRHDSTYMYCDSAYLYNTTNSLEAFDNVRIEQGDTLFIYGDHLIYDGNTSIAKMRRNVRMENDSVTLFTDSFNYDRGLNLAYFFDGGLMVDPQNELTSIYGQYSPDTKVATFKENVELLNPQFVLTSDTLNYHTQSKVATIVGPTVIQADSGSIHSTLGWYNTETNEAMLYERSVVVSKDASKTLTADSIYYDRQAGLAEAFEHMVMNDTARRVILTGNYGYYDEWREIAFATDSAQMIEYSQLDSLYLHADTLRMKTRGEEREIQAYYNVRFFRSDLQGVCDSMQYNTVDSTLYLYTNPIIWNMDYQIVGDTIQVLFNDSTIERVDVIDYAFATQQIDSAYYNQMKGRYLTAYFQAGELHQIDIDGNAETIYYPFDEGKLEYIGRNKTVSSFMKIDVVNRKPKRILFLTQPVSEMLPLPDLTTETLYLPNFIDYEYIRPFSRTSIFEKTVRKTEDVPAPRRRRTRE